MTKSACERGLRPSLHVMDGMHAAQLPHLRAQRTQPHQPWGSDDAPGVEMVVSSSWVSQLCIMHNSKPAGRKGLVSIISKNTNDMLQTAQACVGGATGGGAGRQQQQDLQQTD